MNAIEALNELLTAGIKFREAEYAARTASATKARKAVLAREEARNRLLKAEDAARNVIDASR
jgi:hypothetical protein